MKRFGFFKGLPYSECNEDFSEYLKFENPLPKQKIIEHIESLPAGLTSLPDFDIFTGEKIHAGMYFDNDFIFPLDFIHYYKKYNIGIPYDYENYLQGIL